VTNTMWVALVIGVAAGIVFWFKTRGAPTGQTEAVMGPYEIETYVRGHLVEIATTSSPTTEASSGFRTGFSTARTSASSSPKSSRARMRQVIRGSSLPL